MGVEEIDRVDRIESVDSIDSGELIADRNVCATLNNKQ